MRIIRLVLSCGGLVIASMAPLAGPVTAAAKPHCHGVSATIVGSDAADDIAGTRGRDVIVARDGADVVHGKGGNDLICARRGFDRVFGGSGDDRIVGNRGGDALYGGQGEDRLLGGQDGIRDPDIPEEPTGDTLAGGPGDDVLDGGPNYDLGVDTVTYRGAARGVELRLETGRVTGQGVDRLQRVETAMGSMHDDLLSGFRDRGDALEGLGGDDDLRGFGGGDLLFGGLGADVVFGGEAGDIVTGGGRMWPPVVDDGRDILHGGAGRDSLEGDGGDDVSRGEADGDFLVDSAGDDRSYGGPGDDRFCGNDCTGFHEGGHRMYGGPGDDTFTGGEGHEVAYGGEAGEVDGDTCEESIEERYHCELTGGQTGRPMRRSALPSTVPSLYDMAEASSAIAGA